jgi:hypothetical protein
MRRLPGVAVLRQRNALAIVEDQRRRRRLRFEAQRPRQPRADRRLGVEGGFVVRGDAGVGGRRDVQTLRDQMRDAKRRRHRFVGRLERTGLAGASWP